MIGKFIYKRRRIDCEGLIQLLDQQHHMYDLPRFFQYSNTHLSTNNTCRFLKMSMALSLIDKDLVDRIVHQEREKSNDSSLMSAMCSRNCGLLLLACTFCLWSLSFSRRMYLSCNCSVAATFPMVAPTCHYTCHPWWWGEKQLTVEGKANQMNINNCERGTVRVQEAFANTHDCCECCCGGGLLVCSKKIRSWRTGIWGGGYRG